MARRAKSRKVTLPHWLRDPTPEEIAEQERIRLEILAEKMANGPPSCPDQRSVPKDPRCKVGMLPRGKGVLRGQG